MIQLYRLSYIYIIYDIIDQPMVVHGYVWFMVYGFVWFMVMYGLWLCMVYGYVWFMVIHIQTHAQSVILYLIKKCYL